MKKALIMCNAAMSSSLMAKKAAEYLKSKGYDITVEATTADAGVQLIQEEKYDLYLVSPQIRHRFDILKNEADKKGAIIAQIPFPAYAPIPTGIEKLADLILTELKMK